MKRLARLSNLHGLRDLPPCGNDSDAAEPAAVLLLFVSPADSIFLLLIAAGGIILALAAAGGITLTTTGVLFLTARGAVRVFLRRET